MLEFCESSLDLIYNQFYEIWVFERTVLQIFESVQY